jgi:hypothetical protein
MITNEGDEKPYIDKHVAIYTCQLADFTWWLFVATLVVAIIGIVQGFYLRHHARIAQRSLFELERAYVTAGILGTGTGQHEGQEYVLLSVSALNYGKTPGFIDRIYYHIGPYGAADPKQLPITPDGYNNILFVGWVIGPDTKRHEALQATLGQFRLPLDEPMIFHGLITYTDIFQTRHYSGFAHRINPNGSTQPISEVDAYVRRD